MRIPRQRILDIDLENRPLSYLVGDLTTGEITAIGWTWIGEKGGVHAWAVGPECQHPGCRTGPHHGMTLSEILDRFLSLWERADIVTGHYIRAHDLPMINAALLELGWGPLEPRLVQDTKLDLYPRRHLSSSQESLAAMLGVRAPKVHMSQADWREANRLTPKGIEATRRRVISDVRQHVALRSRLIELGWLRPPRLWTPEAGRGR